MRHLYGFLLLSQSGLNYYIGLFGLRGWLVLILLIIDTRLLTLMVDHYVGSSLLFLAPYISILNLSRFNCILLLLLFIRLCTTLQLRINLYRFKIGCFWAWLTLHLDSVTWLWAIIWGLAWYIDRALVCLLSWLLRIGYVSLYFIWGSICGG